MPENAPDSKRAATAGYGAIIQNVASTQEAREEGARMYVYAMSIVHLPISRRGRCSIRQRLTDVFPHHRIETEKGAEFIHPYDDPRVCIQVSC
jgi:threonine dehydratase